jgi:glucoamylase
VRHAPITHQERWEENAGYSPSTLAAGISCLICAAEIARAHDSAELATFLEEFADWMEGHLEDWTVTNNGVLLPEVKRHYMRIRPPECGEAYAHEGCGKETIHIANRPPGTRTEFEAREIVDAGFLELVRYGVRKAGEPLMEDSLRVVDHVLKRGLPQGPGWLRYNWDGYGERPDGGPFQGWGKGRVWPLLTGERAHYELAAGRNITELIKTYEGFATCGQMMPEQVWDETNLPGSSQRLGQPTGSAVPLVWAHAEYLKLLRSALDGKVFDRIDTVYERYCTPEGRQKVRNSVEIWSKRRPVQRMAAGKALRILDEKWFEVRWTVDGWETVHTEHSRNMGSAGFSADVHPGVETGTLQWTFHWLEPESWLGRNVEVQIEGPGQG